MAASEVEVSASPVSNETGYRSFELGEFGFARDEYFVYINWTAKGQKLSHTMSADAFLRATMRCVAWGFFYGWLNFDDIFGTQQLYGRVKFYAGRFSPAFHDQGLDHEEIFETPRAMATFKEMLADWTNDGYDPFAAPDETGLSWIGKRMGPMKKPLDENVKFVGACQACQEMPRCGRMRAAALSTGLSLMCHRINRRFTQNRDSKVKFMLTICLVTCPAQM